MTGFRTEATAPLIAVIKVISLTEDHAAFWRFVILTVCKGDKPKSEWVGNKKKIMNQNEMNITTTHNLKLNW